MLQRLAGKDAQIAAAQRAEEVAIVSLFCLPALALCSAKSISPLGVALQRALLTSLLLSLTCVDGTLT